jgi:RNA polymerase sigma-32 factor
MDLEMFAEWKRTGSKKLEGKLLADNDKFVRHQISKLCRLSRIVDTEDHLQAGRIGLLIALRKFDPARGKFSTYAAHWIRDQFQKASQRSDREIRRVGSGLSYAVIRRMEVIKAQTGRDATAEELGVTQDVMESYRCNAIVSLSLDDTGRQEKYDGDKWWADSAYDDECPNPEEAYERAEGMQLYGAAMAVLTDEERDVIRLWILEDGNSRALAAKYRTSLNAVAEIRDRALAKMRKVY